ncbi:MAG: MBL fold metallo-hydrolase [Nitrososphaerota archaeon]|nr:MBL fold metallo-hydrolase [Nitrososphaerota archaeon]
MGPSRFKVGDATVTVFEVGSLQLRLDEVFGPEVRLAEYFDQESMSTPGLFPNYSMLIESGRAKVVVDPADYGRLVAPGHFRPPPRYDPPPTLSEQLRTSGVDPEEVTHVMITHLHYDHYAGVTGRSGLTFPRAEHIVPAKDWEMPDIAEARSRGDRDIAETLGEVEAAGRLELLDGALRLGGGISVEPFPGESPGHQVVGVRSKGDSCYCVGDLYHMVAEVEHPELSASWTDAKAILASRMEFAERAAAEGALVLPAHMRAGRVIRSGTGTSWAYSQ